MDYFEIQEKDHQAGAWKTGLRDWQFKTRKDALRHYHWVLSQVPGANIRLVKLVVASVIRDSTRRAHAR